MRFLRMIFCIYAMISALAGVSMEKDSKIVVVGAGIAGLTTSYRLQKGGMDVELYEARNRVGGRVFTAKIGESLAELGGQNLSDGGELENLNPLIEEFDLHLISSCVLLKHSYFNGKELIPLKEIVKEKHFDPQALKKQLNELAAASHNMREILEKIVDIEDPFYKILAVRLAAYEGGSVEELSPFYIKTLFSMILGGVCPVHPSDSSIDLVTIQGGNALLPEKMAEALGSRLHLNMPLVKVAKDQDGTFQLTFKNGERVEADILVLAIPCSVYGQIAFEENAIPLQTLKGIQKVRYGENAKIIVPFAAPPAKINALIGDEIVTFFDEREQVLTVYYTGKTSFFSPQTIASSYAQARPMIEKGFGEDLPPFLVPTYAKDESHLTYEGPLGISWPNDPYARGTYSYIAAGQEEMLTSTIEEDGQMFKTLFAPIEQKLYFAGEHASILFDVPGTIEAACESGERVARSILKRMNTF